MNSSESPSDSKDAEPELVLAQAVSSPTGASPKQSGVERVINSRWAIFVMLFGVLGILGVPLLWISSGFSRREKIAWTVAVVIYTLLLIALTGICVWFGWRTWQEYFGHS